PKARTRTPQNFPLLRFSDVLLMFAEADFEVNKNPNAEAIEAVNKVRRRAWSTGIKSVTVTNGGSGYTSAPQVVFMNGGGSDAVATATVSGGKVTAVRFAMDPVKSFTNGAGYTSEPHVSFVGGGGSGATATATIYKKEEADLTPQDLDDFRQTIQNERLRELAFETLRKADLIRWGVFIYEMNKIGQELTTKVPTAYWGQRYRNVWERHLLWPIPTREMGLNNALVQNPNW
ncbi:MAG TPA: RagB/SusD family nutrient uptake outer membrane protein, partial [Sphingobacteriaceae bacterium]